MAERKPSRTSVEQIAVDQADIMESMAKMIQTLITELAQYRAVEKEEEQIREYEHYAKNVNV